MKMWFLTHAWSTLTLHTHATASTQEEPTPPPPLDLLCFDTDECYACVKSLCMCVCVCGGALKASRSESLRGCLGGGRCIFKSKKGERRGTRWRRRKGGRRGEAAHSLLCKVRSDGEAGSPQCSHPKHRLDGGPGAAEERVPLSVIELHEGVLGDRQTDRQTVNIHFSVCFQIFMACF